EPRATDAGRWSPRTRCMSSLDTNACTTPESPKPRTRAQSVSQNMKKPSLRLSTMSCTTAASALEEAGDGRGRLVDLGRTLGLVGVDRLGHAVTEVLVQQADGDAVERSGRRRDLREDVDAVGVFIDKSLKPTDLAFNPAQALKVVVLVHRVARHRRRIP